MCRVLPIPPIIAQWFFEENIGFSPNGEGENKILDPKGKNSCPRGEATRARNFSLRGQEFYSSPSHWVRILFLRISNSLETIMQ